MNTNKRDKVFYKVCQGEGCTVIMELPYERYKNVKYCPDCRERLRREKSREYMKKKRRLLREIAYGDMPFLQEEDLVEYGSE